MSDLNAAPPRPVAAKPDTLTPKFMTAVIAGVVVSGIYFGRPVLMPLALAVLTSFALAPLVALLKKLRLGNVGSVVISLFLAVVVVSVAGPFHGLAARQVGGRPAALPDQPGAEDQFGDGQRHA